MRRQGVYCMRDTVYLGPEQRIDNMFVPATDFLKCLVSFHSNFSLLSLLDTWIISMKHFRVRGTELLTSSYEIIASCVFV